MSFLFQQSTSIKRQPEEAIPAEPLPKRQRNTARSSETTFGSTEHFGVPIYDMLRALDAPDTRRSVDTLPKTCKTDVLFTDKYAPTCYLDLRGSQDVQRQILRWISRWRPIAFDLEVPESDHTDEFGRPLKKILLVHGPPGAGKTSSVQVMARIEGFDVLEINASDDRGAAAVQQKISSALFSHQAVSNKPVCILADEVDGAESGFVRCLIELLKADARKVKGVSTKGKKAKDHLLQRPIICVCNEAFTRTLFDLRQYCEIVYFPPSSPNRLLSQLEEINRKEGLRTPTSVLLRDIQETGCDFRACLNRLQFGGDRSISYKDSTKSLAEMTLSVFNKEAKDLNLKLDAYGEVEKLFDSCFSQYTNAYYVDDRMLKPASMGDWYALVDSRRFNAASEYAAVAINHMFLNFSSLSNGPMKYERPPKLFEEKKRTMTLTQEARHKASTATRSMFCLNSYRRELVPYVWQLANPEVNNVPTPQQKAVLVSCQQSLTDAGIRLFTEKLENGSLIHRLDPPINLACCLSTDQMDFAAHGKFVHRSHLKRAFDEAKRLQIRASPTQAASQQAVPKPESKMSSNFFSRDTIEPAVIQQNKVWISYREGFSNAVRKRLSWNDMFG
ncbi:Chromosome transmission fidelity protein 18 [Wickerhamiella sorbophila]|uniref:Chromosome transmission fidelity protein 18 n=1 Tax=Wickerhamiella sorbophila TaxID=45607 RepID=A0A2T0FMJ3_9ASCO|nr:Chromosome transmission fidelity protein 18 [Wickerhamiella sorbophila]PRT56189.1 Chromosome transmission fidelity protein 18 [Wickerhamiella sorbophila]